MENKMVFWFVVRVIGITTLLIGLYVLYTGISPFFPQLWHIQWVDIPAVVTSTHEYSSTGDRYPDSCQVYYAYMVDGTSYWGKFDNPPEGSRAGRIHPDQIRSGYPAKFDPYHEAKLQRLRVRGDGPGSHGARIFPFGSPRPSAQSAAAGYLRRHGNVGRGAPRTRPNGARDKRADTIYPPAPSLGRRNHALHLDPHARPKAMAIKRTA